MGGKGSAPAAPDYTGAANAQSAASKEIATQQNWANRPDQYTPWGSTTWGAAQGTDPATGQPITRWSQTQSLDPALQGALDDQLAIQAGRSNLAGQFMGRVANEYSQPFDWANAPGMANTPQAQYSAAGNVQSQYGNPNAQLSAQYFGPTTGANGAQIQQYTPNTNQANFVDQRNQLFQAGLDRMAPSHQRQEDAARTMLANQGLTPGSEAYNTELERLHQQQAGERWNALEQSGQEQARLQNMLMGQQQQAFGQQKDVAQMGLGTQQQAFNQMLAGQQAYNEALTGQQGLDAARAQFYNQAQNQMYNQNLGANQQNFNQMMQMANYQNQLRQQYIAEQAQMRGMSLNEMNALLTGQQVNTPQMPSFMGATAGQAPNLLGAAQAQGQYDLGLMGQQNNQNAGLWGGIGSLAGTAAMFM